MYNEQEDFSHHANEINEVYSSLERHGVHLNNNMTVLDVGAGLGMHAVFLAQRVMKVYCIDILKYNTIYNSNLLSLLKEKYERNQLDVCMDKICFIENSAAAMVFKDDFFDLSISINSFEHIHDVRGALSEMIRVTKPGGYIYVSIDPVWTADTGNHFFHRVSEPWAHLVLTTEQFIEQMLKNGATQHEIEDFQQGINRFRPDHYKRLFENLIDSAGLKILDQSSWSGVVTHSHLQHPNYGLLREQGYSANELRLRGIRYILGKPAKDRELGSFGDTIAKGVLIGQH